jgi:hypothetical protein
VHRLGIGPFKQRVYADAHRAANDSVSEAA